MEKPSPKENDERTLSQEEKGGFPFSAELIFSRNTSPMLGLKAREELKGSFFPARGREEQRLIPFPKPKRCSHPTNLIPLRRRKVCSSCSLPHPLGTPLSTGRDTFPRSICAGHAPQPVRF